MMNSSGHAGYPHRDMGVELCQSTYYTFPLWDLPTLGMLALGQATTVGSQKQEWEQCLV